MKVLRPVGALLMWSGAALGAGVAAAMLGGAHVLPAMPWILGVALAKLTLLGAGGLMGAGAICRRLSLRDEQRRALPDAPKCEPG